MNLSAIRSFLPGVESPRKRYYRVVSKAFESNIDDIGPAFLHGWRYNPKQEFGVLYLSITEECCVRERQRHFNVGADAFKSLVTGVFRVDVKKCLDLTAAAVLEGIGVNQEELLLENDFAVPQAVAREARSAGFEALIAPSAAGRECQSLVVFKDKLNPPSFCIFDSLIR